MAEAFYVGAYWGPRGEPVDQCADRLSRLLALLGEADPRLAAWYRTGSSRKGAMNRPVDQSIGALQKLLLAGRARRDDEARSVMSDLGFRVGLWNGQAIEVGLSLRCGSPAAIPGLTSNTLVLQLPTAEGVAISLYRREVALAVVRSVVTVWEPSWCVWTSDVLRNTQKAQAGEVVAGWATYVADGAGVLTERLPALSTVEQLGTGVMFVAEGDADSASEATVSAIRAALGGALRPVP